MSQKASFCSLQIEKNRQKPVFFTLQNYSHSIIYSHIKSIFINMI